MDDIRHRVGIDAPIAEVYDAVATPDGLATWWTRDTAGESRVGGEITVRFGGAKAAPFPDSEKISSWD
jgi:uncharacterized protein YndB with AHSA1/START domain